MKKVIAMELRELLIDYVAKDMNSDTDINIREILDNDDTLLANFSGQSFDRTYLQFPIHMLERDVVYYERDIKTNEWDIVI